MSIDYLLIGHVTQDLTPAGVVPGGTAFYSAIAVSRLGRRVALVTRYPDEGVLRAALPGVELHVHPCERATTFENVYRGDLRTQVVRHAAPPLTWEDIPPEWRAAPIVHLGPVARDVDPALAFRFPNSLLCLTPQGWMRRWDAQGRVTFEPLPAPREWLRRVDVLVFSAEDVNHDPHAMKQLLQAVPIAVVTRAAEGVVVHTRDGARPIPARATRVVDPTGAGDVFASAYFVRLFECGDPHDAAAFANVVASFAVEKQGAAGVPLRETVEAWLAGARQSSQP